jgi:hypothetical protein
MSEAKAYSNSEYDPSSHQISGRDARRIFAPSPTQSLGKSHTERNVSGRQSKNEDDLIKRVPEDYIPVVEVQRLSAKKERLGETQK